MYREERTMRKLLAILLVMLCGCTFTADTAKLRELDDVLKVSLLKVGKADAIVFEYGSFTMVIDAGEEDDGQEVVDFLQKRNIADVDVLIITHYDQDHVGGADFLVESVPVKQVILPHYESDHIEYLDFMKALEKEQIKPLYLDEPYTFTERNMTVLIEPPKSYEMIFPGEYDNNFSLITTVTHKDNRLVFTGDIEKQRIREWLAEGQQPCDFLKIPHHGVYNRAMEELINTLKPKYAAICSSAKHTADTAVIELIKKVTPEVRETKDGKITVISDGTNIEVNQKVK